MAKLSDAARAEIAEAVRIVKEDKANNPPAPDKVNPPAPKDGDPPPPKDKTDEDPPNIKPGLWWGKRLHDTGE